jgi:hypothetical protein
LSFPRARKLYGEVKEKQNDARQGECLKLNWFLCVLRVLCVSVVNLLNDCFTTEGQRT